MKRVKLPQGGNQRLVYEGIRNLFEAGMAGKTGAPPLRPCIELELAVTAGESRLTCETHCRTTRASEAITGLVALLRLGSEGQEPIRADRLPIALIGPRHDLEAIAHRSLSGRGEAVRQRLVVPADLAGRAPDHAARIGDFVGCPLLARADDVPGSCLSQTTGIGPQRLPTQSGPSGHRSQHLIADIRRLLQSHSQRPLLGHSTLQGNSCHRPTADVRLFRDSGGSRLKVELG